MHGLSGTECIDLTGDDEVPRTAHGRRKRPYTAVYDPDCIMIVQPQPRQKRPKSQRERKETLDDDIVLVEETGTVSASGYRGSTSNAMSIKLDHHHNQQCGVFAGRPSGSGSHTASLWQPYLLKQEQQGQQRVLLTGQARWCPGPSAGWVQSSSKSSSIHFSVSSFSSTD